MFIDNETLKSENDRSLFFPRDLMQGEKFHNSQKAEGKVVIVTGSNTGIGKETAMELAKRKATVYMACRDLNKCNEARKSIILSTKNKNVFCRELDLGSLQSIRNFVKHFKAEQVGSSRVELRFYKIFFHRIALTFS